MAVLVKLPLPEWTRRPTTSRPPGPRAGQDAARLHHPRRLSDARWITVSEIWENELQQESWFNEHVRPHLPAALLDAMSTEYFHLHAVVQP